MISSPRTFSSPKTTTVRYPFCFSISTFPSPHIVDFGVAHIFDTLTGHNQSSGISPFPRFSIGSDLPVSNRPLHMLTRSPTGLMSNTAGTTYFYPPECCADQPYNTYAADVAENGAMRCRSGRWA